MEGFLPFHIHEAQGTDIYVLGFFISTHHPHVATFAIVP